MVTELRWILLCFSVLLLAGIWWWGARRSRQSPKNPEFREPSSGAAPAVAAPRPADDPSKDWGVPPFEPLSIRTADFEAVEVADLPMLADPVVRDEPAIEPASPRNEPSVGAGIDPTFDALDPQEPTWGEVPAPAAVPDVALETAPPAESAAAAATGAATATAGATSSAAESQRIVTLRVSTVEEARWAGNDLLAALEAHGLGYGRYRVFHRKHSDGRTLFCAASLVEPGTFDIQKMPHEHFRGLTLFAVLPGPADPLQTIDAMIATAAGLADALQGMVQDSQGAALSPQRAEALREEVARFQSGHHEQAGQTR